MQCKPPPLTHEDVRAWKVERWRRDVFSFDSVPGSVMGRQKSWHGPHFARSQGFLPARPSTPACHKLHTSFYGQSNCDWQVKVPKGQATLRAARSPDETFCWCCVHSCQNLPLAPSAVSCNYHEQSFDVIDCELLFSFPLSCISNSECWDIPFLIKNSQGCTRQVEFVFVQERKNAQMSGRGSVECACPWPAGRARAQQCIRYECKNAYV